MPAKESDCVVTQTEYWRDRLWKDYNIKAVNIYSCIDPAPVKADLGFKWFGHILRNDKGKYHWRWNHLLRNILNKTESRAYIISRNPKEINNYRIIYNKLVSDENKLKALCELSVAVYAHGSFEEIFPMAILECMSVGLPIVYLYQPSMAEMIGPDQLACDTIKEVEEKTIMLLNDYKLRKKYGQKALERARFFTREKTIDAWNKLFLEIV
jgi:glycosyltransferase involved in cell wall biosynthesis